VSAQPSVITASHRSGSSVPVHRERRKSIRDRHQGRTETGGGAGRCADAAGCGGGGRVNGLAVDWNELLRASVRHTPGDLTDARTYDSSAVGKPPIRRGQSTVAGVVPVTAGEQAVYQQGFKRGFGSIGVSYVL